MVLTIQLLEREIVIINLNKKKTCENSFFGVEYRDNQYPGKWIKFVRLYGYPRLISLSSAINYAG